MMRRGSIYSAILHLAVILIAYFGLPQLFKEPLEIQEPIAVDIVTIADKTSPPKVEPKTEVKPEPPKEAKPLPPAPPLPEPPKQTLSQPEPPKPPEPTPEPLKPEPPQVAQLPPAPTPETQPKPKPEPEKKPEPKPVAQPIVPEPPKAKPKAPPDTSVESILKSVEKIKPRSEPDPADKMVKELARATPRTPPSLDNRMTISEIDAVKRQIERCWNVPAGAKDAKDLIVEIHVTLNPDGSVRGEPTIADQSRLSSDSFFRAAAESARRAILLCQPFKLPPEKYSTWQDMDLRFNPKDIL